MAFDGTLKFDTAIDQNGFKSGIANLGNLAKKGMAVVTGAVAAATAATAALSGAIISGVSNIAAYGDNIDKMSQKLGMSSTAYQEWADDVTEKAKKTAREFLENIKEYIRQLPSSVKEHLDKTISKVKEWADDLKNKGKKAADPEYPRYLRRRLQTGGGCYCQED